MIEIALCLAIIGFAMVAIIGILPTGMQVQKDNREDTIINQDGTFLLDSIRYAITNSAALSNNLESLVIRSNNVIVARYTNELSSRQIIGLLSQPKYLDGPDGYTPRAIFYANSGALANYAAGTRDLSFRYAIFTEVLPYGYGNVANPVNPMLETNLYELRLTARWPVLGQGDGMKFGSGRQVFRTLVSGQLSNDGSGLYFFVPAKFLTGN
jgi:hypothetical protein